MGARRQLGAKADALARGANITIVERGAAAARTEGLYDGPEVFRAFHPLPVFDGMRPVVGSWIVVGRPCGIGIREDAMAITGTDRASCLTPSREAERFGEGQSSDARTFFPTLTAKPALCASANRT
ncbi:hypothetical protein D3273_09005 [Lichenibacterium minor]|uniref:Glutathionylspermidine synthase pre-ATP-grasp-like domain-containing protein n=1 Tax=Lichenibacterium minor TaxID=2316528 RepID=A0A4Q2UB73_9HYPH|nr:hypothetical protein D3273_09005 [Lichenibacterium minor]